MATFKDKLKLIESEGYLRKRDVISLTTSSHTQIRDKTVTSFSSNDYLGMSTHRDVISELKKSANQYGIGSGSSPLITGYTQSHQYLEKEISLKDAIVLSKRDTRGYVKRQLTWFRHNFNPDLILRI